ncbi:MAG: IS1595 family transposase [Candidatus Aureabacteria bacterium]|nr:IS1595 family transposase [Candidatus Auribacterota bacterium]
MAKELNIPYERAWCMIHKIRTAMAYRDMQYPLSGTIEMDEVYSGSPDPGRKRGRGTRRAKAIFAVSVTDDNKPRFARIQMIKRLDGRSVKAFALSRIARGSTVRSDGLHVYRCLTRLGILHDPAVTSHTARNKHLRWIHIVISNAKAFVTGTFHGLDKKHLQRYLDEFCYRFNRRYHEKELFDRLLLACANAPHVNYDELTR